MILRSVYNSGRHHKFGSTIASLKSQSVYYARLMSSMRNTTDKPRRIGIGTNKLSLPQQPDGTYPSVLATSLQNNIDTFESTLHKEEEMRRGMTDAIMFLDAQNTNDSKNNSITKDDSIRVIGKLSYRSAQKLEARKEGDVLQEEQDDDNLVYHNLSPSYINEEVSKSPLVELNQTQPSIHLTYCVHNPEGKPSMPLIIILQSDLSRSDSYCEYHFHF